MGIPPEDWETVYPAYRQKTGPAAAPCAPGTRENVFNPRVLNVRRVQGRRVLSSTTPAKSPSAATSDRAENAECNAPPSWGRGYAPPAMMSLKLTPMRGRGICADIP
jgi:hypothetical protein